MKSTSQNNWCQESKLQIVKPRKGCQTQMKSDLTNVEFFIIIWYKFNCLIQIKAIPVLNSLCVIGKVAISFVPFFFFSSPPWKLPCYHATTSAPISFEEDVLPTQKKQVESFEQVTFMSILVPVLGSAVLVEAFTRCLILPILLLIFRTLLVWGAKKLCLMLLFCWVFSMRHALPLSCDARDAPKATRLICRQHRCIRRPLPISLYSSKAELVESFNVGVLVSRWCFLSHGW